MAKSSSKIQIIKALSVAGLALAGAVFHSGLLAQANVVITKIPTPVTDTGIVLAPARGSAVTTPSAALAWGGARTGREPTLSDRVANYRIAATLDPIKHTVTGTEQLSWRNRSSVEVRSVYVHLYMNAFESGGSTFYTEQRARPGPEPDTKKGEWGYTELRSVTQGGVKVNYAFVHPDNGPATDHTVVRFDLPAAVAPGATTTLDIAFLTKLPRAVSRTGYVGSYHLVSQWFPKIGVLELPGERGATTPRWNVHEHHEESEFYADFGSYDVSITAPKDYIIGATGELQGAPVERQGMLTHRYVQGDVHDFAWTADKRSKVLHDSWNGAGSGPVKLTVLYPPDMQASAAPAMKAAKEALSYFSRTLGPYPYKTLTMVVPPHNADATAGMEYPTFITLAGKTAVAPNTLDATEIEDVTIHEIGHTYFQGILASNEVEEPMLDEGLTNFWHARLVRERQHGLAVLPSFLLALGIDFTFKPFDIERVRTPREEPADPVGQNGWERLQGMGPAYTRSSTMMRDLEARLGQDVMTRAMREYYQRWKFRHPSVADLRETLAEVSGQRAVVEEFFAQQVYATSKIDDRVDKFFSVEELPQRGTMVVNGQRVEEDQQALDQRIESMRAAFSRANPNAKNGEGAFLYRTTVTVRRRGAPAPQTIVVKFADGSSETVNWNDATRWQRYSWLKPARAVSVELDPQRMHYLDTSKLDDSRTLKADPSASRRWSGDFAALFNILLSLIASI